MSEEKKLTKKTKFVYNPDLIKTRIAERIVLDPVTGCWISKVKPNNSGYASISIQGILKGQHVWSYEVYNGEILEGLEVDHICKNTLCCNPGHLQLLTHAQNLAKSSNLSAKNKKKTHCPQGHEYTKDNIYLSKLNQRHCLTCMTRRNRKQPVNG